MSESVRFGESVVTVRPGRSQDAVVVELRQYRDSFSLAIPLSEALQVAAAIARACEAPEGVDRIVCSSPDCTGRAAARWAPDPDTAELLCPLCLVRLGTTSTSIEVAKLLRQMRIVLPEESQLELAEGAADMVLANVEVLP